ncbi:uncharacterized protein [Hetaerina americana]|uniref:uncharacterized protein n=1 Tax=Hetaerina americana TaxID=62018 RepID=UPI003A7F44BB
MREGNPALGKRLSESDGRSLVSRINQNEIPNVFGAEMLGNSFVRVASKIGYRLQDGALDFEDSSSISSSYQEKETDSREVAAQTVKRSPLPWAGNGARMIKNNHPRFMLSCMLPAPVD